MANAAEGQADYTLYSLILLGLTFVTAVVAAWGAYSAAKAGWKAADVSREIGTKQVRAYLSCESGSFHFSAERFFFWINVTNNGQSPALNVEVRVLRVSWLMFDDISSIKDLDEEDYVIEEIGIISAGSTEQMGFRLDASLLDAIGGNAADILHEGYRFAIVCSIRWTDVFDERQTIKVGLMTEKLSQIEGFEKKGNLVRRNFGAEADPTNQTEH